MAARVFCQGLANGGKSLLAGVSRSCSTASLVFFHNRRSIVRLRPLVACASYVRQITPVRGLATRQTSSSLGDPNPNWSNRPPKETILLDGCDFEHWLVVMEKPEGDPTRDEIIDSYIKTLAMVVGSEEEARMKIYSVSTRCYFAFGALVSEELSYKLKELPRVRWVLPDSYLNVKEKDYGGEPFINGEAVPYDPKYHEEWIRNNARANERNRRNDRPRAFDRSRNFERRRDQPNMGAQSGYNPNMPPPANPSNSGPVPPFSGGRPNYSNMSPPSPGPAQHNMGGQPNYVPNIPPPSNPGSTPPNNGGQLNYAPNMPPPTNPGSVRPSNGGQPNYAPNMSPPPNAPYSQGGYPNSGSGGYSPNNMRGPPNNGGGPRFQTPPSQGGFDPRAGYNPGPYQNQSGGVNSNSFSQPSTSGPGQAYHAPNMVQNQGHAPQGYASNYSNGYQPHEQTQNIPTRD